MDRTLLDRLLGYAGLEYLRLAHRQANPESQHAHQRGDDERDAPSPFFQSGIAADGGQPKAKQEGHQGAGIDREPLPGPGEGSTIGLGRFDQESRGGAELPSRRETLGQACQHQDDRRGDADSLVIGADADHQRRQRHQQDGQGQALLAAVAVGEDAQHRPADGAHEEAHSKHGEYREQRRQAVSGGKELASEDGGKGRVDHPVGVFDDGAERRRDDGFLLRATELVALQARGPAAFRRQAVRQAMVVGHVVAPVSTLIVVGRWERWQRCHGA
ncbi:hypothetical protein D9M71_377890 [compost metagenome]